MKLTSVFANLLLVFFLLATIAAFALPSLASSTQHLHWNIEYANVTRLCETRSIVTVNGHFPGPTVYVDEGDYVSVNVTNLVSHNITIHWHGVRQLLTAWADGPAYITQCPIQTGHSYVHKFQVIDQRGTLFWHAHISWLRATVHGAFIIRPKKALHTPFTAPVAEFPPIVLGEWWNGDVEQVIYEALSTGRGYNHSDARTINGQPGYPSNCSLDDISIFNVTQNSTYMLRIINAALNVQLYFAVANHTFTIVEADAEYLQPFTTDVVVVAPGQTTSVLMTADQQIDNYFMAATVFSPANDSLIAYLPTPTTAIVSYDGAGDIDVDNMGLPTFPAYDDKEYVADFTKRLKGQYESKGFYYYDLPMKIDEDLFFTLSYITQPFNGTETTLMAAINNVTFKEPSISLLEAYYNNISGVYDTDFPENPPYPFDYTGSNSSDIPISVLGTKVKVLEFNISVQIVFQNTVTFAFESHPIHLHGTNFYIVGTGPGNYNSSSDPSNFNLHDPPSRNTVAVPSGGWAAIRFSTTNPGVWYMHCHLEIHTSWGMSMAFIVKNGKGTDQTLPPPPSDLPLC